METESGELTAPNGIVEEFEYIVDIVATDHEYIVYTTMVEQMATAMTTTGTALGLTDKRGCLIYGIEGLNGVLLVTIAEDDIIAVIKRDSKLCKPVVVDGRTGDIGDDDPLAVRSLHTHGECEAETAGDRNIREGQEGCVEMCVVGFHACKHVRCLVAGGIVYNYHLIADITLRGKELRQVTLKLFGLVVNSHNN